MGREKRLDALDKMIELSNVQGFVLMDDILSCADTFSLPLSDFDWLSESVVMRGIIVYEERPATLDDEAIASVDDFSQVDYEEIYRKVLSMAPSLDSMISDIRRIKPPQYREISQLQYLVKEGNSHARKRMIEMHLRNAVRVALQRAENYDYDIDEAIQLAFIGLVSAVDKYDPDKNGAFASYANLYMIQSISREQPTQNASVYYPVHKREEYFTVYPTLHSQGFRSNDVGDCECHKWISEISQVLSCSIEHAKGVFDMLRPMPSLDVAIDVFDRQIRAAESMSVDDTTASNYHALSWTPIEAINDSIDRFYTSKQVLRALDTLTSKEKNVIMLRFGFIDGIQHTLEDIGLQFGVTRERIRQLEVKALRKLKHPTRKLVNLVR